MNTEDYRPLPLPSSDPKEIFFDILDKQYDLMIEFFKQEGISKERIDDFNINFYDDQLLFKDFAQIRVCEELCEATEAYINDEFQHVIEELIDAFNFFIELCLIYNYSRDKLCDIYFGASVVPSSFRDGINKSIYFCHMMCNKLKSRPWKGTQYLVDLKVFEERFSNFAYSFFEIIQSNFSLESLYKEWSKKYQVNKFRIESNY